MRYVLRAAVLGTLLIPAFLLLAGRNGVCGGPHKGGASQPAEPAKLNEVVIDNFAFSPRELTVAAGAKVTWVNRDDVPHTATSTARPRAFHSGTLDTDGRFTHVFKTPGTYEYFCVVHPRMTGKIIVK
jgi:plastocyanin